MIGHSIDTGRNSGRSVCFSLIHEAQQPHRDWMAIVQSGYPMSAARILRLRIRGMHGEQELSERRFAAGRKSLERCLAGGGALAGERVRRRFAKPFGVFF